jgi:hypothetical protein
VNIRDTSYEVTILADGLRGPMWDSWPQTSGRLANVGPLIRHATIPSRLGYLVLLHATAGAIMPAGSVCRPDMNWGPDLDRQHDDTLGPITILLTLP